MLPDTSEENFDKAMGILREYREKNLKKVFKLAAVKSHPDQGGEQEVFNTINLLKESVTPFLEKNNKASNEQAINLATTLRGLPEDIKILIVDKIKKENPEYAGVDLMKPSIYQVRNTYQYTARSPMDNRYHFFEVDSTKFDNLKEQFQDLKGDYLKTRILQNIKSQIENTSSKAELNQLKEEIMKSPEYNVLKAGQGLFTKITGIKTSSVKAVDSMLAQQDQNISKELQPKP